MVPHSKAVFPANGYKKGEHLGVARKLNLDVKDLMHSPSGL